jgi:hypothetical protein
MDRDGRGGVLLLLELRLARVEEDVLAICDGAKSLDTTEFDLGTAAVEGPLVWATCEEGEGANVCACEGLGGIDDGVIPEDGIGKSEDGGNAELVGDGKEGYCERLWNEDFARFVVEMWWCGVDVKVDEEGKNVMGASE